MFLYITLVERVGNENSDSINAQELDYLGDN